MGVVKNNRLRYAGHIIRGAKNLPPMPSIGRCRKAHKRSNFRYACGVNSDNRAFGARDKTNFARDRVQWRDLLRQALAKSWL
jgi:hypothetical protein